MNVVKRKCNISSFLYAKIIESAKFDGIIIKNKLNEVKVYENSIKSCMDQ